MNEIKCMIRIITFAERGALMSSEEGPLSPHVLPGQDLIWMALCGEHSSSASHMLVHVLRTADHIALTASISL